MSDRFYIDSSAILRPVLERGLQPEIEVALEAADVLVTSRLSLVEIARTFVRARQVGEISESTIVDSQRWVRALWRRCEIWEITREVCDLAETISPKTTLRSLDAIHLATYSLARHEFADLRLLTADRRL